MFARKNGLFEFPLAGRRRFLFVNELFGNHISVIAERITDMDKDRRDQREQQIQERCSLVCEPDQIDKGLVKKFEDREKKGGKRAGQAVQDRKHCEQDAGNLREQPRL